LVSRGTGYLSNDSRPLGINQLSHYCVDREFTMARYTHEYLINRPTWPTEWILFSVLIAWADYMYTGNVESLEQYYTDLKAKTLTVLEREDGLISTRTGLVTEDVLKSIHFSGKGIRDIVDWPPASFTEDDKLGEQDGYVFTDINTVVNAFYCLALVLMSRITEILGKDQDYDYFYKRAELVKRSINEKLLDRELGIYVDGEGTEHAALHANMFPLAFGLVPEEYRSSVVDFIKSRGMACSVYGSQFLLEALYQADEDEYALELMTSKTDRGWWHMIELGSTITLEAWDIKYKGNMDWNHAWGAAPANIIPSWLMGILPMEPGFGRILIQPRPGTLRTANMVLPTIRGPVEVRFGNNRSDSFTLEIEIPANTTARVALQCMGITKPKITLDGEIVKAKLEGDFAIVDPVGSGKHTLVRR
ncbi:alpha-L-rhamnosidase C-terminal domain-containing protein, partial [Candidatus Poribacteria bacterium]